MLLLKSGTLANLAIGPFLDSTDGITPETGLTITQPDIRLKKNGGDWAQKSAAQTLAHEENGWYEVALSATDTDSIGTLVLSVTKAGALPIWHEFMVVPVNVYDSLILGSDALDVSVTQWLGTAAATPTVAGVPEVDITHLVGVAQSATDLKDFADDGYDPATNKVQGVVLTDTVTTYTGNTPQTGDVFPLASTEIADIKAKTDNLPSDPADASVVAGLIAAVQADTDDIQTRLPAALVGGRMDSSVGSNLDKTGYLLSAAGVAAVLETAMTEAYPADGATMTVAQALYIIKQSLHEKSISGTTMTVKKLDGTTSAATFTLDDADDPISITRAT